MAANLSTHFNVAQHLQWWQIYEAKKQNKKKNERASITIVENMATAGCDQNGKQDFEKETNTRGNKWRFKEFHQNTSQPQMSMYNPPTQTHTKASHSNHCVIWSDTMKVFLILFWDTPRVSAKSTDSNTATASTLNIARFHACATHTFLLDKYWDRVSWARPSITALESRAEN